MRTVVEIERFACAQCGSGVAEAERCALCLVVLCIDCFTAAAWCDGCGIVVCRSCERRAFPVSCETCGAPQHLECARDPACSGCAGQEH